MALAFGALFIVISVGRITEIVPVLSTIYLGKMVMALWTVAIILRPQGKKTRKTPAVSPIAKCGVYLALLACLSMLVSVWPSQTLESITGSLIVLVYSSSLLYITLTDEYSLIFILRTFVLVAAALAVLSLSRYTGQRLDLGVSGASYDTNDLAYVLVTMLPICISLSNLGSGWEKALFKASIFIIAASILLTSSRGAFLSLLALGGVAIYRGGVSISAGTLKPTAWQRLKRLTLAGIVALVTVASLPHSTTERLATVASLSSDYNTDAELKEGRLSIWERNALAAAWHPLGIGLGASAAFDARNGGVYKAMHNSVLLVFVELGYAGLAVYLAAYSLAWRRLSLIRSIIPKKGQLDYPALASSLQVALVTNFIAAFFLSQSFSAVLWYLLATIAAFTAKIQSEDAVKTTYIGGRN
jgi:hypothetical protein